MNKAENELESIKNDMSIRQMSLIQLEVKLGEIGETESAEQQIRFLRLMIR